MRPNVLLPLLLAVCAPPVAAQQAPGRPPNVVLTVADDLGWNDVGFHGGDIDTPSLDRLAAEGVRFEQFFVQNPVCQPSRATMIVNGPLTSSPP